MRIPSRESYRLCWMILLVFRLLDSRSSIQNRNKRCSWIYEISWWIISGRKPVQQQSPIPLSFFEVSNILSDSLKNEINHETSSWLLVYEGENALDNTKKQNIFFGATCQISYRCWYNISNGIFLFVAVLGMFLARNGDTPNIFDHKQIVCPDLMRPWSEKTGLGKITIVIRI